MWEQIRSNRRRSLLLVAAMAGLLAALGWVAGEAWVGGHGLFGVGVAVVLWSILLGTAMAGGDDILLGAAGAREISQEDLPRLFNVVEEMKIASGLEAMPKIYLIDDPVPNAFAVGRKKDRCAVAVTSGLVERLNRDELQGVIGHEISHVVNRDVLFMTLAGVMLGAIVMLADVLTRSMWYGGRRRSSRSGGGGQGDLIIAVVAIALAILAPILAQILYFACSRRREYLADAGSAQLTRYPEGLASALEKIAGSQRGVEHVNRALAPMYIVNPLAATSLTSGLFSTHPATAERVRILRNMAGASFGDYERAYQQVHGTRRALLSGEAERGQTVQIRAASAEPAAAGATRREMADALHRMDGYVPVACACGVRLKVPQTHEGTEVTCPRCGRLLEVPAATAGGGAGVGLLGVGSTETGRAGAAAAPGRPAPARRLRYTRRGTGWESFKCACGHTVQLSPAFSGSTVQCRECGRTIEVV